MKDKMELFILSHYPNAELDSYIESKFGVKYLFYPNEEAELPYTCTLQNGKLTILTDF